MRLGLSKKVFVIFSSLTIITLLLGLIVLAGLSHMRNFHHEMRLVNDFRLLVKDLESVQIGLAADYPVPNKSTYELQFKQAERLVTEINQFSDNFSPQIRQQLQMMRNHLDHYRQAFIEMLQTYEKDQQFSKVEHDLIDVLHDDVRKHTATRQIEFQQMMSKLFALHENIYHLRDISKLHELEEIYSKIAREFPQQPVLHKVRKYINTTKENYINYLALKEHEEFLAETAGIFFSFADETIKEISQNSDRSQNQLICFIIGLVGFAGILTITLWRFASKYIYNFLASQRQAISAIGGGDYDYQTGTVPDDEIGDLSLFLKQLARTLKDGLKKLQDSEAKYRNLVESITDWVWEVDSKGVYTYSSPQVLGFLGYKPEEIFGKTLFDLMPPEEVARVRQEFESLAVDRKNIVSMVNTNIHRDGREIILETSGVPMLDEQGNLCGYRGVVRNITERVRSEEEKMKLERQLQHVQKLESLGVLAGGIAHDFNNLLMAILGNADLALLDMSPVSPGRQNIIEIEKASRRAAELCRQMLAYSGKGKFVVQKLNLSEVVQEMTHMLEVSISKRAILKYKYGENLPAIEGDPTQIRQVVMNLIINASEAIGDKSGIISITTGAMDCDRSYLHETSINEELPAGTYVYLEVADTGCGMDATTRARLFDPFFTTKFTGRGLGMSAVLGIVRGHQGGIKVYTEPGKGTTFKVLFPAVKGVADQLAVGVCMQEESMSGSGIILLVDDDETVRTVGKQMLQHLCLTVLTAEDGTQGLEIFRERSTEIDCVILDLTMPHMDGEETFRELRRVSSEVRVILSSGYNEQEVTQRFVGKGLAGFIQKPYTMAPLKKVIDEVLAAQKECDHPE